MVVLLDHDFMTTHGGETRDGYPAAKFSTGDTISFISTNLLPNSNMNEQDFSHMCFLVFRSYFLKMDGTVAGVCLKCQSRPMVVNFYVWKSLQSCYSFVLKNDQREALQNCFRDVKVFTKYDMYKVVYVSADNVSSFQYFPPHKLLENQVHEVLEDVE